MRFRTRTFVVKVGLDRDGNVRVTKIERHGWTLAAAVAMAVCALVQAVNAVLVWYGGAIGRSVLYAVSALVWLVLAAWYGHRWRCGR